MTDKELDDLLKSSSQPIDPTVLANISAAIGTAATPVRPLPPAWIMTSAVAALSGIVALAGASLLGFEGIRRLGLERIALIFPLLILFTILAASFTVAQMIPGSRFLAHPQALLSASSSAMIVVFAILFHDYDMSRFVPQGIACLEVGLLIAIPAALCGWLVLRRGFAVDAVSAGLAAGTLAGLAGVITLELHCPNFRAMHVMVWHTLVIPVSAAGGALLGFLSRRK